MRRLLLGLLAIMLGFLTALAWYVSDRGFTRKWRNYLVAQFRKEGVEVSFRRVTLDPFHGLVGQEVKVYDARSRHRVLAVIDQVVLGVNYANALRHKTFLDSLDLRDARLLLPLNPEDPEGKGVVISHLNARLFLPPGQISLSRAEAEIYGVRIQAAGHLIHPQDFQFERVARGSPGAVFARIAEALKGLRYDRERPQLRIAFSGDLARPAEIFAEARLHAVEIRRSKYRLDRVDLVASCRGGVVELQQFDMADPRGELHACGTYDLFSREIALRLKSTLALQELNRAFRFTAEWKQIFFQDTPGVDLTLRGTLGPAPRLRAFGHVGLGVFSFGAEEFTGLSADASWAGDSWSVRDFRLAHRTGEVRGDAMQLPGGFRAKLHGRLNLKALLPALAAPEAQWLSQFDFVEAPAIDLTAAGQAPTLDGCEASGEVRFAKTNYLGSAPEGAVHLDYGNHLLTLTPFPDAQSGTRLVFDFQRHEVRSEKLPEPALPALSAR
jgi:hypothetical protein